MKALAGFFLACLSILHVNVFAVPGFDFYALFLPEDPVIIDAGAHDGTAAVAMANRWPDGQIYSFEPSPNLHDRFLENVAFYSNIAFFPIALGDQDGFAQFNVSSPTNPGQQYDAQGSLLTPNPDSFFLAGLL